MPQVLVHPIFSENHPGYLAFAISFQGRAPKRPKPAFSLVPAQPQQHCPCLSWVFHMKNTRPVSAMINTDNTFTTRWCHVLETLNEGQMLCRVCMWQSHMWPMRNVLLCPFWCVTAWAGHFFLNEARDLPACSLSMFSVIFPPYV